MHASSILDKCSSTKIGEFNTFLKANVDNKKHCSSYFLNIDGNKSNFDSLTVELDLIEHKFSVIGLAETNTTPDESSVYQLPEYNSFYQDTIDNKSKGTGVALYIHESLSATVIQSVSDTTQNLESLFVTTRSNSKEATFGVLYRPPNGEFSSFLNELTAILQLLPKKSVQLMGDLNVNLLNDSKERLELEEVMLSAGFFPVISIGTHEKPGCKRTCIDNILTNDISNVIYSGVISESISHHLPIFGIFENLLQISPSTVTKCIQLYDYRDANIEDFLNNLKISLDTDIPRTFSDFYEQFSINLDKACKLTKPKNSKRTPVSNPWITGGIATSVIAKHELHDNWQAAKNKRCVKNPSVRCSEAPDDCQCYFCKELERHRTLFTDKRRRVKHIINIAKKRYYCQKIDECDGDSKKTWEIINNLRGKSSRKIKPSFVINNERIVFRRLIAHEFNKYFVSIATNLNKVYEDPSNDPILANTDLYKNYLPASCKNSIYMHDCTESEIATIITELKNGKASDVPIKVIKQSSQVIAGHLACAYNKCMSEGTFPCVLKTGKVTPIYKKDNEELVENYRPVSTLPVFGKIFEKVIYSRLYSFFTSQGILYENQFGFRKGHSTSHALNFSVNHIEANTKKGKHVLGIFIDLSKAFDTLPFDKLLFKLSHYGIRGNALKLLESYLTDRRQYVAVLGEESEKEIVKLGVPQGSVLGPLLFLIYINDIYKCSDLGKFVLFADDTNIFVSADTIHEVYEIANQTLHNARWIDDVPKDICHSDPSSEDSQEESNVEKPFRNGEVGLPPRFATGPARGPSWLNRAHCFWE
ncbi:hypothetical protein ACHWQZ_G015578 [Mnemiopsis leidyi]